MIVDVLRWAIPTVGDAIAVGWWLSAAGFLAWAYRTDGQLERERQRAHRRSMRTQCHVRRLEDVR